VGRGPLVGHGALLVGRQVFFILLKMIILYTNIKNHEKLTLLAAKASRNNKIS